MASRQAKTSLKGSVLCAMYKLASKINPEILEAVIVHVDKQGHWSLFFKLPSLKEKDSYAHYSNPDDKHIDNSTQTFKVEKCNFKLKYQHDKYIECTFPQTDEKLPDWNDYHIVLRRDVLDTLIKSIDLKLSPGKYDDCFVWCQEVLKKIYKEDSKSLQSCLLFMNSYRERQT